MMSTRSSLEQYMTHMREWIDVYISINVHHIDTIKIIDDDQRDTTIDIRCSTDITLSEIVVDNFYITCDQRD
jgi:hypothetical protein